MNFVQNVYQVSFRWTYWVLTSSECSRFEIQSPAEFQLLYRTKSCWDMRFSPINFEDDVVFGYNCRVVVYKMTKVCDAGFSSIKIESVFPKKRRQCSPQYATSHIRSRVFFYFISTRKITTLIVILLTPEFRGFFNQIIVFLSLPCVHQFISACSLFSCSAL